MGPNAICLLAIRVHNYPGGSARLAHAAGADEKKRNEHPYGLGAVHARSPRPLKWPTTADNSRRGLRYLGIAAPATCGAGNAERRGQGVLA